MFGDELAVLSHVEVLASISNNVRNDQIDLDQTDENSKPLKELENSIIINDLDRLTSRTSWTR